MGSQLINCQSSPRRSNGATLRPLIDTSLYNSTTCAKEECPEVCLFAQGSDEQGVIMYVVCSVAAAAGRCGVVGVGTDAIARFAKRAVMHVGRSKGAAGK